MNKYCFDLHFVNYSTFFIRKLVIFCTKQRFAWHLRIFGGKEKRKKNFGSFIYLFIILFIYLLYIVSLSIALCKSTLNMWKALAAYPAISLRWKPSSLRLESILGALTWIHNLHNMHKVVCVVMIINRERSHFWRVCIKGSVTFTFCATILFKWSVMRLFQTSRFFASLIERIRHCCGRSIPFFTEEMGSTTDEPHTSNPSDHN